MKCARGDCSTGDDKILMEPVKRVASYIAQSQTNMLKRFIKMEKFQTNWKTARISPGFRVQTLIELSDYRQISNLF